MYSYNRFRDREGRAKASLVAVLPFALLAIPVVVAPANPVTGPIPHGLAVTFRWLVVFGTVLLWLVLASTHAWVVDRTEEPARVALEIEDADVPTLTES